MLYIREIKIHQLQRVIFICLIGILFFSCRSSQTSNRAIIIDSSIDRPIFHTQDTILNPLSLPTDSGFDNVGDSNLYTVQSTVVVNNDILRKMRFAKLKRLSVDSLCLIIFEENPAYNQSLRVFITNGQMDSQFKYKMPSLTAEPNIQRLEQKIVVQAIPQLIGEKLAGSIY